MYRINNQSAIHKDSDWTSSRVKEFYLKLRASGRMSLKNCVWRMRLKKRVWRRAPEDTSSEARSSEALIIRSISRQKLTSPELTKDNVRSVRPLTLQPPSLQSLSLHQDKDNINIAADVVSFVMEWIWN